MAKRTDTLTAGEQRAYAVRQAQIEIEKAAEKFVKQHVQEFQAKVPARDVQAAIKKVASALEEVRAARAEAERNGISMK